MSKYYLSQGYNLFQGWDNDSIKKVKLNDLYTLEDIDLFTSRFNDINELKRYLYDHDLIDSLACDVVIATNKTDKIKKEKRLVKIFNGHLLIFKSNLDYMNVKNVSNYKELANKLWNYIKEKANDKNFMKYIVYEYMAKYGNSKKTVKAPIYSDGSLGLLNNCLSSEDYALHNKEEYQLCFCNFFYNELYKCDRVVSEIGSIYNPNKEALNIKGIHDMLIHIMEYIRKYEPTYKDKTASIKAANQIKENDANVDLEHEEFLESRDFFRPLFAYAKQVELDLDDIDKVENDDYAQSFILDEKRLVKKNEGIE